MIRKIFFALLFSISQSFLFAQSSNTALDQSFGLCDQISAFLPSLTQFPTPTPFSFAKVLVLPDDKIMVSGPFRATLNGSPRNYLLRLNADGTVDESFDFFGNSLPVNQPSIVTKVIPLPDGKYLICGAFSQVVGNASEIIGVYRIHSDGSIDSSFNTFILSGDALDMGGLPNGNASAVYDMDLMPDGKIVIGGNFHQFGNDSINCIAMLNADGTLFNGFSSPYGTGVGSEVFNLVVTNDSKIITSTRASFNMRILRENGIVDTASTTLIGPFMGTGIKFAKASDGKIVMAGSLGGLPGNQTGQIKVARFNSDFTLDNSFTITSQADHPVIGFKMLPNGKFLVSGNFTTYGGSDKRKLVRLNSDGTLDLSFDTGGNSFNSGGAVYAADAQSDGKIVCYHNLTHHQDNILQNNNVSCFIIRLQGDELGNSDQVPNPPSNLTATPTNSILLNWQDNSDNEEGFKVESAQSDSGPWVEIADLAANSTSYLHTGLENGVEYFYRVKAYNAFGSSNFSNVSSAVEGATGFASEMKSLGIALFPNPATDYISLHGLRRNGKVLITSMSGQICKNVTAFDDSAMIISLSDLAPGVYTISVVHEQFTAQRTILIQK